MTLRRAALVLALLTTACGGGPSSTPTAPTAPTPDATATRIIALSGNVAFGNVLVGSSATASLTIGNNGNSSLTWTGLSTGTTVVTASATSGTVAAGAAAAVTLTFTPTVAQNYAGTLTATSDATSGTNTMAFSGTGTTAAPPPGGTPGVSCGVERWPVKTLADTDATRVNMSAVQVITIQALNALPAHCSGLPDPRTYSPEFQVYETTGRIVVVRSEDDRDYHLALAAPDDASSTIVTELADVACSGAATSIYRDLLASARSQFETFRGGQSLASLTGRLITVRGVGFYDFDHGQTGRSQNCLELHPVTYVTGSQAPAAPVISSFTATPSSITYPASAVLAWAVSDATSVSISNGIGTVEAIGQHPHRY